MYENISTHIVVTTYCYVSASESARACVRMLLICWEIISANVAQQFGNNALDTFISFLFDFEAVDSPNVAALWGRVAMASNKNVQKSDKLETVMQKS